MVDLRREPQGIGGWLILPMIGLILIPVLLTIDLFNTYLPIFTTGSWRALTDPESPAFHPLWKPVLLFEILGNITFIGYAVVLLVAFFLKFHRFPLMYIAFLILNVIFVASDLYLAQQIPAVAAQPNDAAVQSLTRAVVGAAIWIPYFLVSKRVKNTFVKRNQNLDRELREEDQSFDASSYSSASSAYREIDESR
jgi:hypothetical protein